MHQKMRKKTRRILFKENKVIRKDKNGTKQSFLEKKFQERIDEKLN